MFSALVRKRWTGELVLILFSLGIFLRVNRYLCNFPFWSDEAWVAVDLAGRSWQDILWNTNLDASFSVPAPGFMLMEKLLVSFLGLKEMVFRFVPCVCGVASVFLFKRLLKGLVQRRAMLSALAFFVLSNLLIGYSSELKQYSSDIFFTVLVLVAHFRARKRSMDEKSTVTLVMAGILGLIFSLPIILVLCGLGVAQVAAFYHQKDFQEMKQYQLVLSLWLIMFLALWVSYYGINFRREDVLGYQKPFYLSLPFSVSEGVAFFRKLFSVFESPVELSCPGLAALMFAAGCWSLWQRQKAMLLTLILPVVLTVGLSMANHYPFFGRFLVFLLPVFFIIIAQGIDFVMEGQSWRWLAGLVILAMLLVQPVAQAQKNLLPSCATDIRSLILYLHSHNQAGDTIYLNNDSQWGYRFYYYLYHQPPFPRHTEYKLREQGILYEHPLADDLPGQLFNYLTPQQAQYGRVGRRVYGWDRVVDEQGNWTRLPGGGRTWILLSQVTPEKKQAFLDSFDAFGKKLDEVHSANAALYLYDLK